MPFMAFPEKSPPADRAELLQSWNRARAANLDDFKVNLSLQLPFNKEAPNPRAHP
jgi:hypothetical protein